MSQWNWEWHPNTIAMSEALVKSSAEIEKLRKQVAELQELAAYMRRMCDAWRDNYAAKLAIEAYENYITSEALTKEDV